MTRQKIIPRRPNVKCIDLHTAAQKYGCRITCDGKVLYLVREKRRPDLRVVGGGKAAA